MLLLILIIIGLYMYYINSEQNQNYIISNSMNSNNNKLIVKSEPYKLENYENIPIEIKENIKPKKEDIYLRDVAELMNFTKESHECQTIYDYTNLENKNYTELLHPY